MTIPSISRRRLLAAGLALGLPLGAAAGFAAARLAPAQDPLAGSTFRSASGTEIRFLLAGDNLGGSELEVAEITFPPGTNSGDHPHGATEVFYVLEGELEHIVDGVSERLGPGDLGFVRPPSHVNHRTDPDGPPTRALVLWAPGGEGARIVSSWERLPD